MTKKELENWNVKRIKSWGESNRCRFGLFFEKGRLADTNQGYCQRYAPRPGNVVFQDNEQEPTYWPLVSADDWCGEYEEKESK